MLGVYFVRQLGYLQAELLQSCLTNRDWYDIWQVGGVFYLLFEEYANAKYKIIYIDNIDMIVLI